jgi:hypothetical protein
MLPAWTAHSTFKGRELGWLDRFEAQTDISPRVSRLRPESSTYASEELSCTLQRRLRNTTRSPISRTMSLNPGRFLRFHSGRQRAEHDTKRTCSPNPFSSTCSIAYRGGKPTPGEVCQPAGSDSIVHAGALCPSWRVPTTARESERRFCRLRMLYHVSGWETYSAGDPTWAVEYSHNIYMSCR